MRLVFVELCGNIYLIAAVAVATRRSPSGGCRRPRALGAFLLLIFSFSLELKIKIILYSDGNVVAGAIQLVNRKQVSGRPGGAAFRTFFETSRRR